MRTVRTGGEFLEVGNTCCLIFAGLSVLLMVRPTKRFPEHSLYI